MGNPDLASPEQGPQASPPKEAFLGIALRGWAVFAISLIVVCATLAHYSIRIYGEWQDQKTRADDADTQKQKANQERDKLESVNQITSANTNLITQEMTKHINDKSGHQFPIHIDGGGQTVATYFESDGCIALARPGKKLPYLDHPGDRLEWSLGPSVASPTDPANLSPSSSRVDRPDKASPSASASEAQEDDSHVGSKKLPRLLRVQAGCLNPHPWPFTSWWGPANGCIAPQYRKWKDGCTHYQLYNSCRGQWDPKIYWTTCNPNHHQ